MLVRRLVPMLVLLSVSLAVLPAADAGARRHKKATASSQVRSANTLLRRISRRAWARGARGRTLGQASGVARSIRRRQTCRALLQTEALRLRLRTGKTWTRHRVPKAVRTPQRLLGSARAKLLRQAGRRCAVAVHHSRRLRLHRGSAHAPHARREARSNEQGEGEEEDGFDLKRGHFRPLTSRGRPTGIDGDPHDTGAAAYAASGPFSRLGADDSLKTFRASNFGTIPNTGSPREPAVAEGQGVVWYTGNTRVGLSTNAGRTFTIFDPSNILPDQGLAPCCDQLVSYDRRYHVFVWVLQYWCVPNSGGDNNCNSDGTGSNRLRFAVATPDALKKNAANPANAWKYFDTTPASLGFKEKTAWFDRSDMSISDEYLDFAVDILRAGKTKTILARLPMRDLTARYNSDRVGSVSWATHTDGQQRFSVAQGTQDTGLFVGAKDLSTFRIWAWPPGADEVFLHEVGHTTTPNADQTSLGSDSKDYLDRIGVFSGSPDSAAVLGGRLYVAITTGRAYCQKNCGDPDEVDGPRKFDHPATYVGIVDTGKWKTDDEKWLWNKDFSLAYPALSPSGAGDMGIAMHGSADKENPRPILGTLTPSVQGFFALPAGQPTEAGDYYTLRPGRTPHSWVTTNETISGGMITWDFLEYGFGPTPYVSPPSVVGSSRVDLQACKLEYSIVSPK